MKIAIPVFGNETATTFDFSRELLVIDFEGRREIRRYRVLLDEAAPHSRTRRLVLLGVEVLICGAISRPLANALEDAGIRLFPLVSGPVDEVVGAVVSHRLSETRFLLPGCTVEDRANLTRNAALQCLE